MYNPLQPRFLDFQIKNIINYKKEELNKILEEVEDLVQIHFLKTKVLFKYQNIL